MKLLQVTTIPETLEAFILPFAHHFREKGWFVGGMAAKPNANEKVVAAFDALHDVSLSRNPVAGSNWGAASAIRAAVAQQGYDIVHVHTPVAAFVTRFALRKRPRPFQVVYTAHGFHFHEAGGKLTNLAFSSLERIAGPWTDELVVINRDDEAAARRLQLVPSDRLHFIPGIGLDLAAYDARTIPADAVAGVRRELGIGTATPLFLVLGEFTPNKRQADVVAALAQLTDPNGDPPHLALAGVGPTQDAVRTHAHSLGVADRVHFLGFRRDASVLARAANAMLLTSEREGLPRSIIEAMALGTPVIASDIRGVRDLLQDGRGVLVASGDVDAIAAAMRSVIVAPRDAAAMAARAHDHAHRYGIENVLARYEQVYAACAARLPGRRASDSA